MRKILRGIFLFLGVSAIALMFQACYGMPPDQNDGWKDGDSGTEYNNKPADEEKQETEK